MLGLRKSCYIFICLLYLTEGYRLPRPKRKLKSQYLYESPTTGRVGETLDVSTLDVGRIDYSGVSGTDWGIYDKNPFTFISRKPLPLECRSTAYYKDYVWLDIKQRNEVIKTPRPYHKELRDIIYKNANAEICHQPDMLNVIQFLECQIRRHMRLELEVPNYPAVPK